MPGGPPSTSRVISLRLPVCEPWEAENRPNAEAYGAKTRARATCKKVNYILSGGCHVIDPRRGQLPRKFHQNLSSRLDAYQSAENPGAKHETGPEQSMTSVCFSIEKHNSNE